MSANDDSFEITSFDNYLINEIICETNDDLFERISNLSESTEKSVEEILQEAETLISYPQLLPLKLNFEDLDLEYLNGINNISCESTPLEMRPGIGMIDKMLNDVFEVS